MTGLNPDPKMSDQLHPKWIQSIEYNPRILDHAESAVEVIQKGMFEYFNSCSKTKITEEFFSIYCRQNVTRYTECDDFIDKRMVIYVDDLTKKALALCVPKRKIGQETWMQVFLRRPNTKH